MPQITLQNACKSYGSGSANAVSDLDLSLGDGEFTCLLGPSGCGKTTTLRMIAGLENLSSGSIRIGDNLVDCVSSGTFVPPERRGLGLVFQSYALWPHLTIERNTDFGLRLRKVPKAEREARVNEVMATLGIDQYRDRYPSQLSGGQQQRVALARMLAVNPKVLLLDEPLSNLDARLRLEMRAELKRIHKAFGTTIVFVTHDQWEAMTLATSIAVMADGKLQQMGTPDDIYDRPANRFVAEFVGSPPINIVEMGGASGELAACVRAFFAAEHPRIAPFGSLGIRPEAMGFSPGRRDAPGGSFTCEAVVAGILPTGGSWIVEVAAGGQTLFLTTHKAPRFEAGTAGHVHAAPGDLHVFDAIGSRVEDADGALRERVDLHSARWTPQKIPA